MKMLNLKVPAVHCQHCVHTISMELSELEGVEDVNVNETEKSVKVAFSAPANEAKIRELLKEINYPAEE